jgi:hypothetical protein
MDFAQIVKSIANQNNKVSIHFGVVTAKTNGNTRLSVQISGSTTAVTGVRYLHSYAPQVSDVVVMIINNGDIVVLGDLA